MQQPLLPNVSREQIVAIAVELDRRMEAKRQYLDALMSLGKAADNFFAALAKVQALEVEQMHKDSAAVQEMIRRHDSGIVLPTMAPPKLSS